MTSARWLLIGLSAFCASPRELPAATALLTQWDLNGTLTATEGGGTLTPAFTAPAASPQYYFTNVTIAGQSAQVACFSRGTCFITAHQLGPNGGGAYVNQFTLVLDVMFPSRPAGWAALFQTSPGNANDGDWFINPSAGLGISGVYGGVVADGIWHRLALSVDNLAETLTSYIDGAPVQQLSTGVTLDGRFSLDPTAILFGDDTQENAAGYVNSVQFRGLALTAADIAALGGPSAAGIPLPAPPGVTVLSPNGGEAIPAGSIQTVSWLATNAVGDVRVELWRAGAWFTNLGTAPLAAAGIPWAVSPYLGDATNYRVRLASLVYTNVADDSDQDFAVTGSLPANPRYGQPLQTNGGFEAAFTNWVITAGTPQALNASAGQGSPHGGTRFFHGGINTTAAVACVRQDIDLLAAGFAPAELDLGSALAAEVWLRNDYGAGVFDDQVFLRAGFLDESREELSALRCIIPGNSVWSQKLLTGLLPSATRHLRVEVVGQHRRDPHNDSMADDIVVRLTRPPLLTNPKITKQPMLQDYRQDAMTLLWETDGNFALHAVEWGHSNVTENTLTRIETLQIDAAHFVHRATLTGLTAETAYTYRVRSGSEVTPAYTFMTAPKRDTAFAVAWWGDNHEGTATLRTHVSNLLAHAPNLICVAGDMVNSGNSLSEWHNYWFLPLEHLHAAQTTPVLFARGNHDAEHALAYAYSALPGNEAWFSFDYGNTRFIFLDSEIDTTGSPEQLAWLQAELDRPEARRAAFRIVCFHRPPWTDFWNGGGYTGETWVRNAWAPLFAQKNVDLVISGHTHAYCRGVTNGVTYVVSGGGGGVIDTERVASWPLFTVEYSQTHFDLMEVDGCTLTWQTFNAQNQMLDFFALRCRTPVLGWATAPPGGGLFAVVVEGRRGQTYVLERSANLSAWTPLRTNTIPAAGPTTVTNVVDAGPAAGFFRARTLP